MYVYEFSHSVTCYSLWPHGLEPDQLLCTWNFPGKNSGASCHFYSRGSSQRLNWCILYLLHVQADSLPLHHLGNPIYIANTTHTHRWIHVGQFRSFCYQTNLTQAQIMYYLPVPQNSCKCLSLRTVPSEVGLSFSNLCFPLLFLCSPNSSKKLSTLHTRSSLFHSFTFSFFCLRSPLPSLYEKVGCQHPMGDDEDDLRMGNLPLRFKISGLIIYGIIG